MTHNSYLEERTVRLLVIVSQRARGHLASRYLIQGSWDPDQNTYLMMELSLK